MLFRDRAEAGQFLSRELLDAVPELRTEPVTVLAIPRGGVPVAAPIALLLRAPLDVFIARKLGAPGREELAIGAVAADGTRVIDHELVRALHVSEQYIEKITEREIAEAQRRLALFRGGDLFFRHLLRSREVGRALREGGATDQEPPTAAGSQ